MTTDIFSWDVIKYNYSDPPIYKRAVVPLTELYESRIEDSPLNLMPLRWIKWGLSYVPQLIRLVNSFKRRDFWRVPF